MILFTPGKINDYLHLVDLKQFGKERVLSCFIGVFDEFSLIMDCGSSIDVKKLLRYMKNNEIPFNSVKYIIVSHHHFDITGGLWRLYEEIKKNNSEVKILSSKAMIQIYNNHENESHYIRARKTFGPLMGEIKNIDRGAFIPVDDSYLKKSDLKFLDVLYSNGSKIELAMMISPGHSIDHINPVFIKDNVVDFVHLGEAFGVMQHSTELVTAPSSAPGFKYDEYMLSAEKLKNLSPNSIGFSHYGAITGVNDVKTIMVEHLEMMKDYRALIIKFYQEKPETSYILEKIRPIMAKRVDYTDYDSYRNDPAFNKLFLTTIYGMMMDLGYRK